MAPLSSPILHLVEYCNTLGILLIMMENGHNNKKKTKQKNMHHQNWSSDKEKQC